MYVILAIISIILINMNQIQAEEDLCLTNNNCRSCFRNGIDCIWCGYCHSKKLRPCKQNLNIFY